MRGKRKRINKLSTMKLPLWITIYTIFHILLELVLGIAVWMNPAFQFAEIADVASFPIGLYAVRSIAVGVVMLYALLARDFRALAATFFVRLVTDLLDLVLVTTGNPPATMSALPIPLLSLIYVLLFYIPEILAIRILWSRSSLQA